eukprot:comp21488_c1_seq1/m.29767 comp21488_c1_seq1/g.29767  ORF comp21488_c1_seq1/g.29767 comp21488_c1_seq1/m.29767 type:complete len:443 (+) comp21488_c1_seq1:791-2119(+)
MLDEVGGDGIFGECGMDGKIFKNLKVGLDSTDLIAGEGVAEFAQSRLAVIPPHDKLGDHGIIVHTHAVALPDTSVDAHTLGGRWGLHVVDLAGDGKEVVPGVLCVDTSLEGMAMDLKVGLFHRETLTAGHLELPLDKILTGDQLCDWVLDLQPRVHLHEVELLVFVHNKLHRAGTHIPHGLGRTHGCLTDAATGLLRKARSRGLFNDLLVSSLDAAVTLKQIHTVPPLVRKHLHLYVPRVHNIFFHKHPVVAETLHGFTLGRLKHFPKLVWGVHHPHALATATKNGLDQNGITDLVCRLGQQAGVLVVSVVALDDRHIGGNHDLLALALGAHIPDGRGGGPNENDVVFLAGIGKMGVLGKETIAGVDGLCTRLLGHLENDVTPQIALTGWRRPNVVCLIGHLCVHGVSVCVAEHSHCAHAKFACSVDDAACNLTAVSNKDLV